MFNSLDLEGGCNENSEGGSQLPAMKMCLLFLQSFVSQFPLHEGEGQGEGEVLNLL